MERPSNKTAQIAGNRMSEGFKMYHFIISTLACYICYISAGIFEEKIFKTPYARTDSNKLASHISGSASDYFTDQITPLAFSHGLGTVIGYLMLEDNELNMTIPFRKFIGLAAIEIVINITLIAAMMRTSYVMMVMVNSCSLLSVVVVGTYCSGVKDIISQTHLQNQPNPTQNQPNPTQNQPNPTQNQPNRAVSKSNKIGKDKIWICLLVCVGILVFSYFSTSSSQGSLTANHTSIIQILITITLLGIAITCEGFRPDFQAQIKQEFMPSPLFMYYNACQAIFILSLGLSLVSLRFFSFLEFIRTHDRLLFDIAACSLLNSIGTIFAYRLIMIFRQHIYPLVATVRRMLNIIVNVMWYGRTIVAMQWIGILMVFGGILIEILTNYQLFGKIQKNIKNFQNPQEWKDYKIIAKEENEDQVSNATPVKLIPIEQQPQFTEKFYDEIQGI